MATRFTRQVDEYLTSIAIKTVKGEDWLKSWESLIKTLFTEEGDNRLGRELGLPSSFPPFEYENGDLEALIKEYEEKLSTIGDDAQLANIDMQNWLQKQQQTLQQMSNVSKLLHDSAMAIVRKVGG